MRGGERDQTVSGPHQSPTLSLEVSGSQTDRLTPWYNGRYNGRTTGGTTGGTTGIPFP